MWVIPTHLLYVLPDWAFSYMLQNACHNNQACIYLRYLKSQVVHFSFRKNDTVFFFRIGRFALLFYSVSIVLLIEGYPIPLRLFSRVAV